MKDITYAYTSTETKLIIRLSKLKFEPLHPMELGFYPTEEDLKCVGKAKTQVWVKKHVVAYPPTLQIRDSTEFKFYFDIMCTRFPTIYLNKKKIENPKAPK